MSKKDTIKATQTPAVATSDLEILYPDQPVKIAGRNITVREYRFVEGLRLQPLYADFINDIFERVKGGEQPEMHHVIELLGRYESQLIELIAASADVSVEWIAELSDDDGMHLMYVWWTVNVAFFMRRVHSRIAASRVLEKTNLDGA